jgi:hypothetical protein
MDLLLCGWGEPRLVNAASDKPVPHRSGIGAQINSAPSSVMLFALVLWRIDRNLIVRLRWPPLILV